MSDLPTYPQDAAEREAAQAPPTSDRQFSSWGRRVAAYLLDSLIMFVPLFVVIGVAAAADVWAVALIGYVGTLVLPFVYFTFFHGDARGQTPGKRVLGIRVVGDETGRSIGYGRAFGRYAITFVFGFFVLPIILDYLWPLWDSKNQALHGKVVGSVVVRG
ncbi:MAG TPA: RDD family protein [Gaiellaceae bacterium]|nr:RDD family protein [Gaiellaceae bacterium]